ncbi:DMT family transporter [Hydrogenophaga sp.]|uniref:DMT family transporter n=1 Tax=Hydrogenophaga sp. TaxID=1904254 RepID=UPI00345B1231
MNSSTVSITPGLPTGMTAGVLAGLGAGAFWGMAFVAPLMAPGFSAVDITVGRYLACAALSIVLMGWAALRGAGLVPTWRQAAAALGLSVLGYTGYYLLLAMAIQTAGATLPVLVIGTIPLWMMLLGKPAHLRWASLLPGLLLTAAGMGLMMQATAQGLGALPGGPQVWLGVFYAALATASWVLFGLLNARWLAHHPEVNSTQWANWLGVAAGLGALLIWAVAGTDLATLSQQPGFGSFVLVCVVTGIGAAWVASVLWNMASRRLSGSLAGQLIVSETVFGLLYGFLWFAHWPALVQWLACGLFLAGLLASMRAHR